jgi:hypothetical protein
MYDVGLMNRPPLMAREMCIAQRAGSHSKWQLWEELIACFPFTTNWVLDTSAMTSGGIINIPSLMMIVSGIPVIWRLLPQQVERLQCWDYWWEGFMKYAVEMTWGFMAIGSDIKIILRLLPQQFERLQCWDYWWEGFMKCVGNTTSGGMIYIPNFVKISTGVQVLLGWDIQIDGHTHTQSKLILWAYFYFFKIRNVGWWRCSVSRN